MSKVKGYFDTHSHSHAYHNDPKSYDSLCQLIKANYIGTENILDIGCGDGAFIKRAISIVSNSTLLGTDVSYQMIKSAQENLRGLDTDLIVCDAFNLPIRKEYRFDVIHVDSVLHHLIGRTKNKSLNLVKRLLKIFTQRLSAGGLIVVEEVYYDSYVIPSITSAIIFYALKAVNYIHFDISPAIKEFQLGLEVNFMHTGQIRSLLEHLGGSVNVVNKNKWSTRPLHRVLMLKDHGHITYTCKIET